MRLCHLEEQAELICLLRRERRGMIHDSLDAVVVAQAAWWRLVDPVPRVLAADGAVGTWFQLLGVMTDVHGCLPRASRITAGSSRSRSSLAAPCRWGSACRRC